MSPRARRVLREVVFWCAVLFVWNLMLSHGDVVDAVKWVALLSPGLVLLELYVDRRKHPRAEGAANGRARRSAAA